MNLRWLLPICLTNRENEWFHSADPEEAWKEGWGWLVRGWTIGGVTVADVAAWYASLHPDFSSITITTFAVLGVAIVFVLVGARSILRRFVFVGASLHRLCDSVREDVANILAPASSPKPTEQSVYKERYDRFHDDVAERIADVFRRITDDSSVNCAIRLAGSGDDEQGYATEGRSKAMATSRSQQSKAIPSDKGVAWYLRHTKDKRGVLIVRDIQQAIKDGVWFPTPTDGLRDVLTQMIVPINGYAYPNAEKNMVGLLHVTSMYSPFRQVHLEPLMAIADLLGLAYPIITGGRTTLTERE